MQGVREAEVEARDANRAAFNQAEINIRFYKSSLKRMEDAGVVPKGGDDTHSFYPPALFHLRSEDVRRDALAEEWRAMESNPTKRKWIKGKLKHHQDRAEAADKAEKAAAEAEERAQSERRAAYGRAQHHRDKILEFEAQLARVPDDDVE